MAKVEFGGRIGPRLAGLRSLGGPPVPKPPEGAPNIVMVVLDDVRLRPARVLRVPTLDTPVLDGLAGPGGAPLELPHHRPVFPPTRACLLTGRNHHRSAMGGWPTWPSGFPVTGASRPAENRLPVGDPGEPWLCHLRRGGSGTSPPRTETNHGGVPVPRGPWAVASTAGTGSHGGETHQFMPALFTRQPRHPTVHGRSLRGYHLSPGSRRSCHRVPG